MKDVIDPVEALRKVRAALFTDRPDEIAPLNEQAVVCTLWADKFTTLRDFLDMEIDRLTEAGWVLVPRADAQTKLLNLTKALLDDANEECRTLRSLLASAQEDVCSLTCRSLFPAGHVHSAADHSDKCRAMIAAASEASGKEGE
jgi:hypothetical protein